MSKEILVVYMSGVIRGETVVNVPFLIPAGIGLFVRRFKSADFQGHSSKLYETDIPALAASMANVNKCIDGNVKRTGLWYVVSRKTGKEILYW